MDGLSSAVSAFPLAHTIRPSHYTEECVCVCVCLVHECKAENVIQRENNPLHSGVSLILEVNGRSSNGNFNLELLTGLHGCASDLYREAFISLSVNVCFYLLNVSVEVCLVC